MNFFNKKLFLILAFCCPAHMLFAQTTEDAYNRYTEYNLAIFEGKSDKAFELGEKLLPEMDKLPAKTRTAFQYTLGKQYEDRKQFDKALPLYERVVAAEPDYYVVHLALGHIYLGKAKQLQLTNKAAFTALVNKIIPHLEKVQACDPYDENLALIKQLYRSVNKEAAISSINERLKPMRNKCIDLLQDH
ncbi:tetratricopeptide repeat protein [Mucilaginibacter aquatilis]|uniref:Tetratricopeptide repeat protein n=1 Tax=Mucilaginibacter aquatilis TaxID=1517760 RepID=A0A6I4ICL3_9SPHI|nr:tetratricopeptide repeat protein [Mucilaginibacter aquatilis]MVN92892.1 tetratricopeptide repeat protein [Mucilaginibacter aquatilis]